MASTPATGDLVPLGAGPVATVYAGIDNSTGAAVVFKAFPAPLDRQTRAEFDREQAALATLRDLPSILPVEEVLSLADGRMAVRMARCAQSMAQLIEQQGPLSQADTLVLGETVAIALAAAHRAGVTHGGLTPHNVLLRPSGVPVVADFGTTLRQRFDRAPQSEVDYLAPETLRDGTMDEQSDLYGLGAVLYLALMGISPYPARVGEQPSPRILRVLSEPIAPVQRPDIPAELSSLVTRLLAKDPRQRPPDADTVAAELRAMQPNVTQEATPPDDDFATPPEPLVEIKPPNQKSRSRAVRYGIPIAAGIVVAALVPVLLSTRDNDDRATLPPPTSRAPAPSAPAPAKAILLELDPPVDHGDFVELSWRASGNVYFAVIVATEGQDEPKTLPAQYRNTMRVPVEPGRMYCFAIQATDAINVYESQPKPIRGASCKK